ncbi:cytochrome c maturation protein CcmE [Undibacterium flavidum]|uniref:Cytochrome c-type biogenesis protein CcmE n=1 Tax=Undibacterium flavidum TaxID=2762297 RepID=A0ABR6Y9C0_9BURK|nr:cytochrome c maturation protein CcmE [Undibacterium flavidum]MBC3873173.1 cytochrome c maturation protein CcmE [Undibacterium flavidum]
MKSRHQRLLLVLAAVTLLGLATWFILSAFQKNLVFFFTPSQVIAGEAPQNANFRIGGMVEAGSLQRDADGISVQFVITDRVQKVLARYRGSLPDLFKEGKGVVAQGKLTQQGIFLADQVLAKHDENYMPPEAKYAIDQAKQARSLAKPE